MSVKGSLYELPIKILYRKLPSLQGNSMVLYDIFLEKCYTRLFVYQKCYTMKSITKKEFYGTFYP